MTDLLKTLDELKRLRERTMPPGRRNLGPATVRNDGTQVFEVRQCEAEYIFAACNHSEEIETECRRLLAEVAQQRGEIALFRDAMAASEEGVQEEIRTATEEMHAKLKAADHVMRAIDQIPPVWFANHCPAGSYVSIMDARRAFGEPFRYEHESL